MPSSLFHVYPISNLVGQTPRTDVTAHQTLPIRGYFFQAIPRTIQTLWTEHSDEMERTWLPTRALSGTGVIDAETQCPLGMRQRALPGESSVWTCPTILYENRLLSHAGPKGGLQLQEAVKQYAADRNTIGTRGCGVTLYTVLTTDYISFNKRCRQDNLSLLGS